MNACYELNDLNDPNASTHLRINSLTHLRLNAVPFEFFALDFYLSALSYLCVGL
jgi:hypothetical protein